MRCTRRRLALALVVPAALALLGWRATRPAPLMAEERAFVGRWAVRDDRPPVPVPPEGWLAAVEYRADRTVAAWVVWPSGGETAEDLALRWRVSGGVVALTQPRGSAGYVEGVRAGDVRAAERSDWRVEWDGADRWRAVLVLTNGQPPVAANPPTVTRSRVPG